MYVLFPPADRLKSADRASLARRPHAPAFQEAVVTCEESGL
ncbi:hypothetical protein HNR25_004103 [Streptomonospora salina]|uniref:Uncharacterized protein n=1 Tax=Streptomonospora salina TaxID=104205 RepID=A0A841EBE1_9ACTN|nr:hypothetical protein [Streptomonospora salina]